MRVHLLSEISIQCGGFDFALTREEDEQGIFTIVVTVKSIFLPKTTNSKFQNDARICYTGYLFPVLTFWHKLS